VYRDTSCCLRDEEAAGSNPATPTGKRQVTRHLVACRSHYAFPGVRFWEPVGSEHRLRWAVRSAPGPFPVLRQLSLPASRARLRRASPSGPTGLGCRNAESSRGSRNWRKDVAESWAGSGATRRLQAAACRALPGGKPYGRAAAATPMPRTRRQAVLAVTRPR